MLGREIFSLSDEWSVVAIIWLYFFELFSFIFIGNALSSSNCKFAVIVAFRTCGQSSVKSDFFFVIDGNRKMLLITLRLRRGKASEHSALWLHSFHRLFNRTGYSISAFSGGKHLKHYRSKKKIRTIPEDPHCWGFEFISIRYFFPTKIKRDTDIFPSIFMTEKFFIRIFKPLVFVALAISPDPWSSRCSIFVDLLDDSPVFDESLITIDIAVSLGKRRVWWEG